jgi:hypothetical protein
MDGHVIDPLLGVFLDNMEKKLRNLATTQKVTAKDIIKVVGEAAVEAIQDPIVKFGIGLKLAKSGWNDLVSLFKKGFEIAKEYNSTIVESARSIGMSKQQMMAMTEETRHSGYTLKQTTKAIADMNEQLGLSVDLGAANIPTPMFVGGKPVMQSDGKTPVYSYKPIPHNRVLNWATDGSGKVFMQTDESLELKRNGGGTGWEEVSDNTITKLAGGKDKLEKELRKVLVQKGMYPKTQISISKTQAGPTQAKSYTIKGKSYSESAIQKAASASGMSVDEYIKEVNK